jgi:hypothetical protein
MTHNTESILDENGFEILVGYEYEQSPSQIEEGHGLHEVGYLVYTELKSVELVFKGRGIDIIPFIDERQKEYIINLLNYE